MCDFFLCLDVYGIHVDCERPPAVENASIRISDDESNDLVSATYTCKKGYAMHGEPELFCDLDTDEWQGDPPSCKEGKSIFESL